MEDSAEGKAKLDWGLAATAFAIVVGLSIATFKHELIEVGRSFTGIEINMGDLLIAYLLSVVLFAKYVKKKQQKATSTSEGPLRQGGPK